jgi:hypothetical protein
VELVAGPRLAGMVGSDLNARLRGHRRASPRVGIRYLGVDREELVTPDIHPDPPGHASSMLFEAATGGLRR